MISSLLPAEATNTTPDLFEKQPLLITFDNAFTQKRPGIKFPQIFFGKSTSDILTCDKPFLSGVTLQISSEGL